MVPGADGLERKLRPYARRHAREVEEELVRAWTLLLTVAEPGSYEGRMLDCHMQRVPTGVRCVRVDFKPCLFAISREG